MHPVIFEAFEEICKKEKVTGPVLEVGAVEGPDSLLRLPSLKQVEEKVGISPEYDLNCGDYAIFRGNANSMELFEDNRFSSVLCNSVLEHDPYFWRTLNEIKRVTKPGGLIVIGVPGYGRMGPRYLRLSPEQQSLDWVRASTLTLGIHNFPGDYYRFSEQAVREVFMEGLEKIEIRTLIIPPRILAKGRKP